MHVSAHGWIGKEYTTTTSRWMSLASFASGDGDMGGGGSSTGGGSSSSAGGGGSGSSAGGGKGSSTGGSIQSKSVRK